MRGKLVVVVGLPRSGKSSFSRRWESENSGRVVVCADNIRKALHGHAYIGQAEEVVHSIYYTMIRTLLLQGYEVLADDTHTSISSLLKMCAIDLDFKAVHIDTDEETCIQRAHLTNQSYLEKPIRRLAEQFRKNFPVSVEDTVAKVKEEYRLCKGKYTGVVD